MQFMVAERAVGVATGSLGVGDAVAIRVLIPINHQFPSYFPVLAFFFFFALSVFPKSADCFYITGCLA